MRELPKQIIRPCVELNIEKLKKEAESVQLEMEAQRVPETVTSESV